MPTALVTGANRGLGLECVKQLAERSCRVLLAARDQELGQQAAAGIPGVRPVELDVESPESVARLRRTLEGEVRLDALVNNAGTSLKGFDAEVARRTIEVNYRGAARVTDALLPLLSPEATVVMVSSGMGELGHVSGALRARLLDPELDRRTLDALVDGFVAAVQRGDTDLGGFPRNAYSVSKVALNALTRILARELAREGSRVRVNAVCPGWVRTRMGGAAAPRDVEQGARGIVWAALLGPGSPTGAFFRDQQRIEW